MLLYAALRGHSSLSERGDDRDGTAGRSDARRIRWQRRCSRGVLDAVAVRIPTGLMVAIGQSMSLHCRVATPDSSRWIPASLASG